MYLIVGLGNPGNNYALTRHNLGRQVLDLLAERWQGNFSEQKKLAAQIATTEFAGEKIILCRPTVYMNDSGQTIKTVAKFYKIKSKHLIVLYDDLDLIFGRIKLAINNSSGGHNGIKSIIEHLGSRDFLRLRLGIGPSKGQAEKYVLQKFSALEKKKLPEIAGRGADCLTMYLTEGLAKAATLYNS